MPSSLLLLRWPVGRSVGRSRTIRGGRSRSLAGRPALARPRARPSSSLSIVWAKSKNSNDDDRPRPTMDRGGRARRGVRTDGRRGDRTGRFTTGPGRTLHICVVPRRWRAAAAAAAAAAVWRSSSVRPGIALSSPNSSGIRMA